MYADVVTDSMREAIDETRRRRDRQMRYNTEHGIEPQTIRKAISDIVQYMRDDDDAMSASAEQVNDELAGLARDEVLAIVASLEEEMAQASKNLAYEDAARLRDRIVALRARIEQTSEDEALARLRKTARKGSTYGRHRRS